MDLLRFVWIVQLSLRTIPAPVSIELSFPARNIRSRAFHLDASSFYEHRLIGQREKADGSDTNRERKDGQDEVKGEAPVPSEEPLPVGTLGTARQRIAQIKRKIDADPIVPLGIKQTLQKESSAIVEARHRLSRPNVNGHLVELQEGNVFLKQQNRATAAVESDEERNTRILGYVSRMERASGQLQKAVDQNPVWREAVALNSVQYVGNTDKVWAVLVRTNGPSEWPLRMATRDLPIRRTDSAASLRAATRIACAGHRSSNARQNSPGASARALDSDNVRRQFPASEVQAAARQERRAPAASLSRVRPGVRPENANGCRR